MTRWIGRLLMSAAVAHTVIALVRYQDVVFAIVRAGVFNTVVGDPVKGAVAWSLLFGGLAFIGGMAVDALERSSQPVPKSLGWSFVVLGVLGAVLVPASGFWLLFPAAMGILRHPKSRSARPEPE